MNQNDITKVTPIAPSVSGKNLEQNSAAEIVKHNIFELDSEVTLVNISLAHAKLMIDELSEDYFDIITDNDFIIYGHNAAALKNQIALYALFDAMKTMDRIAERVQLLFEKILREAA